MSQIGISIGHLKLIKLISAELGEWPNIPGIHQCNLTLFGRLTVAPLVLGPCFNVIWTTAYVLETQIKILGTCDIPSVLRVVEFCHQMCVAKGPERPQNCLCECFEKYFKIVYLSGLTIKGWKCLLGSFCDTSNTLGGSNGIEMGLTVPISAIPFSSCSMVVFHILIAQGHREQCCSQFDVTHIVFIPVTSMVNYCNCLRNENVWQIQAFCWKKCLLCAIRQSNFLFQEIYVCKAAT